MKKVDRSSSNSTVAAAILLCVVWIAVVILLINVIQCQALPFEIRAIAGVALVALLSLTIVFSFS